MLNLKKLDVSNDHLYGQVLKFREAVIVMIGRNPNIKKPQPLSGIL